MVFLQRILKPQDKPKGYDVTDCKNDYAGNGFIKELEKEYSLDFLT